MVFIVIRKIKGRSHGIEINFANAIVSSLLATIGFIVYFFIIYSFKIFKFHQLMIYLYL